MRGYDGGSASAPARQYDRQRHRHRDGVRAKSEGRSEVRGAEVDGEGWTLGAWVALLESALLRLRTMSELRTSSFSLRTSSFSPRTSFFGPRIIPLSYVWEDLSPAALDPLPSPFPSTLAPRLPSRFGARASGRDLLLEECAVTKRSHNSAILPPSSLDCASYSATAKPNCRAPCPTSVPKLCSCSWTSPGPITNPVAAADHRHQALPRDRSPQGCHR